MLIKILFFIFNSVVILCEIYGLMIFKLILLMLIFILSVLVSLVLVFDELFGCFLNVVVLWLNGCLYVFMWFVV